MFHFYQQISPNPTHWTCKFCFFFSFFFFFIVGMFIRHSGKKDEVKWWAQKTKRMKELDNGSDFLTVFFPLAVQRKRDSSPNWQPLTPHKNTKGTHTCTNIHTVTHTHTHTHTHINHWKSVSNLTSLAAVHPCIRHFPFYVLDTEYTYSFALIVYQQEEKKLSLCSQRPRYNHLDCHFNGWWGGGLTH